MPEEANETNEETREVRRGGFFKGGPGIWQLVFKFFELIFCIVCVALISVPVKVNNVRTKIEFHHIALAYSAFTSYIIINLILILSRLLSEPIGLRASLLYSIVGAGLFFVTSVFLFVDKSNLEVIIFEPGYFLLNMWTASASFALINALVFVGDAVYTFVKRDDFD